MNTKKERPILMSTPMIRALLDGRKTQTRRLLKPQVIEPKPRPLKHAPKHPGPYFDAYCGERKTEENPRGMSDRWCWWTADDRPDPLTEIRCPFGAPGHRLWVREAFTHVTGNGIRVHYRADGEPTDREGRVLPTEPGLRRWWPSIHMPRRSSRITLEITDVRVERLQDIDELDALAEGIEGRSVQGTLDGRAGEYVVGSARDAFAALWDELSGKPRPLLDDDGDPVLDDDERPIVIPAQTWETNPWVWALSFKCVETRPGRP